MGSNPAIQEEALTDKLRVDFLELEGGFGGVDERYEMGFNFIRNWYLRCEFSIQIVGLILSRRNGFSGAFIGGDFGGKGSSYPLRRYRSTLHR